MRLVDTHAHLYLNDFKEDMSAVVQKAKQNGIEKVYLPAIDNETHHALLALVDSNPNFFRPMMGVHPCSIKENYLDELAIARQLLDSRSDWSAIGEIGLDYHWDVTFKEQQKEAFDTQVNWAIQMDLPVVIHSRKSTYDCVELLKLYKGKVKGVFHCFSGSLEEAKEITKLGLLLGIGGVVTYKNSGLKDVLPEIGLEHLVLETDSPYLTPVPHRGKRNESAYVRFVADEIAHILGKSVSEVANVTTANAETLFR
jgi:TatD DNase family protein